MTTLTGVISYPIPAYSNLPIKSQFYEPSRFVISAISMGFTTTITTSIDHNFSIGNLVRILIPPGDGATDLNNSSGYVLSIPASNQVVVGIDSTGINAFTDSNTQQSAQIMAIGDINSGATNTGRTDNQTYINGSFINISPQ